jgi:hypothetical protein
MKDSMAAFTEPNVISDVMLATSTADEVMNFQSPAAI